MLDKNTYMYSLHHFFDAAILKISKEISKAKAFKFYLAKFSYNLHSLLCTLVITSSIFLSSCIKVGPDFHEPPPPCNETYTEKPLPCKTVSTPIKAGKAQHFAICKQIPADWWTLFHSPELNELICLGMANSPNVEAAQAALRQSQELMKAVVGISMFPSVYGQASAGKQRFSPEAIGAINQPPITFTLYTATLYIVYYLDVFGGARRKIESMGAQVDNKCFLVEAAYLTLTSNIVTTAITEASLREQIKATHDLVRINEKQLEIMSQQLKLGGTSLSEVLAQKTQLEQLKATLPPLEKNLSVTRHALASLVGFFPSDKILPNFYLDKMTLPEVLPVSLPSDLVRQRPDIRASEALLHKACAEVGVATSNLYPQFVLTGSYGSVANTPSDLFKNLTNVWSYAGQVIQPIFNAGALQAYRRAAVAALQEASAQYQEVVLQGFQNVADSLRAIEIDARALKIQSLAEKSARDAYEIVQKQYQLGGVNYLALLNAEAQYQKTRLSRIQAQAARFSDTAALFQALGGGWWNDGQECRS